MSSPPSLQKKLAKLIAGTTVASLVIFCAIAYLVIYLEEDLGLDMIPEADDQATEFLILAFGVAAPLSLAITLAVTLWHARRALAPIESVIRAAARMSVDDLGERLPLPAERDELHDLVTTLNGLFARLETGFHGLHTFAADASHELRTPLTVVINELEVAYRRPRSDAEWREAVGAALVSLRRLVELIEALLALARGGIAGARQPVELAALVDEVVSSFTPQIEESGVEVAHVSPGPVTAHISRPAMATALSAVLANALRYTPRGGRVELRTEASGSGEAVIRVSDSGPGIDAGEREQIFAPLARGSAGRAMDLANPDRSGLGLGLAIVKRIMEQHQGEARITASALGGTTFTLAIPGPAAP